MKLKFHIWLTLCLFVFSALFVLAVFQITFSSLESRLIEKSKDKLSAVNILKRRLIELHIKNKWEEVTHIFSGAKLHHLPDDNLIENLRAISEIKRIGLMDYQGTGRAEIQAEIFEDSALYQFVSREAGREIRLVFGLSNIQSILLERTGLGITGESYIVNSHFKMMSSSIFMPETYPAQIACNTRGVNLALEGKEGMEVYNDYRGVPVMGAYRPVKFKGIKMALLTEIDLEELMAPIEEIKRNMYLAVAGVLALSLVTALLLARVLSIPILRLRKVADSLSLGALPPNVILAGPILEMQQIARSMESLISSLQQVAAFAHNIGKGNMNACYTLLSEQDELGRAIVGMRDQLVTLNNEKNELEVNSKKMLIEAQEKDRERISRDMHDGLGALLTTMKLKMENAGAYVAHPEIKELMERTISETRVLARNLMPSVLRDFGLNEALRQLVADMGSGTGVSIRYLNELEGSAVVPDKEKQVYIFRMLQEAVSNAVKHAHGSEIVISITVFDDHLVVFVKDNGSGFDAAERMAFAGHGLRNIEERVRLMKGNFFIDSDNQGTALEIEIPLV